MSYNSDNSSTLASFIAVIIFAAISVGVSSTFCGVDDKTMHEVLEAEGYSNIKSIPGYAHAGCSEDDHLASRFEATTIVGARVAGTLCCGYAFKNCTTRIDHVIKHPVSTPAPAHVVPPRP